MDNKSLPSLQDLQEEFDTADSLKAVSPDKAMSTWRRLIDTPAVSEGDEADELLLALKEKCIYCVATALTSTDSTSALQDFLTSLRPLFSAISKAKTGKIMRSVLDLVAAHPSRLSMATAVCVDIIAWCRASKRSFLRLSMESRLCEYYLAARRYPAALKLVTRLVAAVKRLDDKHLLVEVHLIESKIHHALNNVAKAKAALTACRAAANSIYIGPLLQASMDMQAGSISSEERDYKTSYSYFYEAFEGFDGLKDARAPLALKYMLLGKIMNEQPGDVKAVMAGKLALKYAGAAAGQEGAAMAVMQEIAASYEARDLGLFEEIVADEERGGQLRSDLVIRNKLQELKDKLLERNLLRLLEPFEQVEIAHIAALIKLPQEAVQSKLSQMILDKKFNGILDQGSGAIIVFEEEPRSNIYTDAVGTIEELNLAVDQLFEKAKRLD